MPVLTGRWERSGEHGPPEQTPQVTFEIKNLNWTLTTRKSTVTPTKVEVWEYKASGIITTKVPALQHGGTVVLFEYKASPISMWTMQEWTPNFSLLTDGTGEIDQLDIGYDADQYKENPGPPKLEWRVLGYVPLVPAKITVE